MGVKKCIQFCDSQNIWLSSRTTQSFKKHTCKNVVKGRLLPMKKLSAKKYEPFFFKNKKIDIFQFFREKTSIICFISDDNHYHKPTHRNTQLGVSLHFEKKLFSQYLLSREGGHWLKDFIRLNILK